MTLQANLKRYAVLGMIVGGSVLALSGLCTGLFMASGPDQYVPNALGVLGIGAVGIVPSGILFFASRHILKNGPCILPGLLVLLIGTPFLAMMLFNLINTAVRGIRYSYNPFPVGMLIFLGILTAIALAITVFGIKTIRAARAKPDAANEF